MRTSTFLSSTKEFSNEQQPYTNNYACGKGAKRVGGTSHDANNEDYIHDSYVSSLWNEYICPNDECQLNNRCLFPTSCRLHDVFYVCSSQHDS